MSQSMIFDVHSRYVFDFWLKVWQKYFENNLQTKYAKQRKKETIIRIAADKWNKDQMS